jgi:hypothetical protein
MELERALGPADVNPNDSDGMSLFPVEIWILIIRQLGSHLPIRLATISKNFSQIVFSSVISLVELYSTPEKWDGLKDGSEPIFADNFIQKFIYLQDLLINRHCDFTNEGIKVLVHLTTLSIEHNSKISDESLKCLTNITRLNLDHCGDNITDKVS